MKEKKKCMLILTEMVQLFFVEMNWTGQKLAKNVLNQTDCENKDGETG